MTQASSRHSARSQCTLLRDMDSDIFNTRLLRRKRERKSACQSIKGTCRNDPTACAARRCDVSGLFSTRSAASSWITSKWLPSCATGVHVYIRCGVISDCMWPARNTLPAESRLCLPRAVKEMVSAEEEECEFVRGGVSVFFFFSRPEFLFGGLHHKEGFIQGSAEVEQSTQWGKSRTATSQQLPHRRFWDWSHTFDDGTKCREC